LEIDEEKGMGRKYYKVLGGDQRGMLNGDALHVYKKFGSQ
jgi:hypothetical protein